MVTKVIARDIPSIIKIISHKIVQEVQKRLNLNKILSLVFHLNFQGKAPLLKQPCLHNI